MEIKITVFLYVFEKILNENNQSMFNLVLNKYLYEKGLIFFEIYDIFNKLQDISYLSNICGHLELSKAKWNVYCKLSSKHSPICSMTSINSHNEKINGK